MIAEPHPIDIMNVDTNKYKSGPALELVNIDHSFMNMTIL